MNVVDVAHEALRILRRVECSFSTGPNKYGSGFVWTSPDTVVTCAHVVQEPGSTLSKLLVNGHPATLLRAFPNLDLAFLRTKDSDVCTAGDSSQLRVGCELTFAGFPSGVRTASVFGGIVSAIGDRLIDNPRCELIQINGMINLGNSGGPVLSSETGEVVGIITAKNVPLLREIDSLRGILRSMPQFPSEVGIGQIDFSKFVNLTMKALLSVSSSLRLVQVGVGYAVPVNLFPTF
jgi:serine protease Do